MDINHQWRDLLTDDKSSITIGRYQINGVLGSGGMGTVLSAWDDNLARMVAIKIVRSASPEDNHVTQLNEFLLGEGRAIANLVHPNICRLYDLDEDEGIWYLVMELIEGLPLSTALSSGIRLSLPLILQLVKGIAAGLDYAHQNGVVHRDIKPSNLMITRDRGIKILDFGVAQFDRRQNSGEPAEEICAGTPRYMAPEQMRGERVTGSADQYSLATVTEEMLAQRASNGPIQVVLLRALSQSPKRRYETCSVFASALKRACLMANGANTPIELNAGTEPGSTLMIRAGRG